MNALENHPLSNLELTRPEKQVLLALRSLLPPPEKEPADLSPYNYSISGKGFEDSWYKTVFARLRERAASLATGRPIAALEGNRIDLCPVSLFVLYTLGKLSL